MKIKKIGDYLIENKSCDKEVVDAALKWQITLKQEGIYKPVGQIIIERGDLKPETLNVILRRQGEDVLRSVELFKSLPSELVSKIAKVAECQALPKGRIIIHEGDQGDSFFQIISGMTRVFRISEDGIEVTLATLGPGENFGEMALLTGEPRSASVETLEASGLLVISKQSFDQLAAEIPEFSLTLSKILSSRLVRGALNLVSATSTEKAYRRFVSEQSAGPDSQLIGRSKAVKQLQAQIQETAQNDMPVLVTGEPGTEKRGVAGLIHISSKRKDSPLLVIDVKTVNMGRAVGRPREHDPIRHELAQSSTLFGHVKGALSFAEERRLGLFQVGDGGTVVIENIEHLTGNVQTKLADFIQHGSFHPLGSQNLLHASVRVVATSSVDLGRLVEECKFSEHLFGLLEGSQILAVPPLRKRKRDLRQLVEVLIKLYSEKAGKSVTGIEHDVYKSIMAYDWPGNTEELKVVIRRAVNLVQGTRLTSEYILIGTAPETPGKLSFNILKLDRVRQLFQSRTFPDSAQLAAAFFFVLLIFLGFFGSQRPGYNATLELTWGLWEPLVVLSCVLAARIWCAVCPVGAASSLISRRYGLGRNVPAFIRNYGVYIGAVGVGLIFLSEVIFEMPFSPRVTAVLILSITLPALALALVYRRRIWCRFLCPLGQLIGFLSRCSVMELRANHNICNNDCMEHSCYVGHEGQPGCPVFEAPFALNTNQNCILCGNCIKNCPNQSPTLNLRTPGHELWNFRKPDIAMALLGPILMGTQLFRGLEKTGHFHYGASSPYQRWVFYTVFIIITICLAFVFVKVAGKVVFESVKNSSGETSGLIAYAFLPLVVAFELGFHFERLLTLGGQLLPSLGRQLGFGWNSFEVNIGPGLVKACQILVVLIGLFASQAVFKRLIGTYQQATPLLWRQYWPIWLLAVGYVGLFGAG